MNYWYNYINKNIRYANQNDLSRYATAIKKVAMKAIKLCKKYGACKNIQSVEYVAVEKTIYVNGKKRYIFS